MGTPAILETVKLFVEKRVSCESLADFLREEFECMPKDTLSKMASDYREAFPEFKDFAALFFVELSLQLGQVVAQRTQRFFLESEDLKDQLSKLNSRLKSRDDDVHNLEKIVEE